MKFLNQAAAEKAAKDEQESKTDEGAVQDGKGSGAEDGGDVEDKAGGEEKSKVCAVSAHSPGPVLSNIGFFLYVVLFHVSCMPLLSSYFLDMP